MTKVAKPVASPLQTEKPFNRKTIYLLSSLSSFNRLIIKAAD